MFTRLTVVLVFLPMLSFAMPNEIDRLTQSTYKKMEGLKTYKQKIATLTAYQNQLETTEKTFKDVVDLVEFEGLKLALLELDPAKLALRQCSEIQGNLKSKFYPRGIATKDGPTHYRYAMALLKPFCT